MRPVRCLLPPLALLVAAASAQSREPVPGPAPAGRRPQFSEPPTSIVFGVAFSRDGRQLAVGCLDATAIVYDTATGARRAVLRGHAERVWSVAFSPDGATLVSGSGEYRRPTDPGEVKVWDLTTAREQASLAGHRGLVFSVAFAPDGKSFATASWDTTIKVWDAATLAEKATLSGHAGPVRSVAYSPDGTVLA